MNKFCFASKGKEPALLWFLPWGDCHGWKCGVLHKVWLWSHQDSKYLTKKFLHTLLRIEWLPPGFSYCCYCFLHAGQSYSLQPQQFLSIPEKERVHAWPLSGAQLQLPNVQTVPAMQHYTSLNFVQQSVRGTVWVALSSHGHIHDLKFHLSFHIQSPCCVSSAWHSHFHRGIESFFLEFPGGCVIWHGDTLLKSHVGLEANEVGPPRKCIWFLEHHLSKQLQWFQLKIDNSSFCGCVEGIFLHQQGWGSTLGNSPTPHTSLSLSHHPLNKFWWFYLQDTKTKAADPAWNHWSHWVKLQGNLGFVWYKCTSLVQNQRPLKQTCICNKHNIIGDHHQSHFRPPPVSLQTTTSLTSDHHQSHWRPPPVSLETTTSSTGDHHQSHLRPPPVPLETTTSLTGDHHQSHLRPPPVPLVTTTSPTGDHHQSYHPPVPLETTTSPTGDHHQSHWRPSPGPLATTTRRTGYTTSPTGNTPRPTGDHPHFHWSPPPFPVETTPCPPGDHHQSHWIHHQSHWRPSPVSLDTPPVPLETITSPTGDHHQSYHPPVPLETITRPRRDNDKSFRTNPIHTGDNSEFPSWKCNSRVPPQAKKVKKFKYHSYLFLVSQWKLNHNLLRRFWDKLVSPFCEKNKQTNKKQTTDRCQIYFIWPLFAVFLPQ